MVKSLYPQRKTARDQDLHRYPVARALAIVIACFTRAQGAMSDATKTHAGPGIRQQHSYACYGVRVDSDLPLPELAEASGQEEGAICIRQRALPQVGPDHLKVFRPNISADANTLWLSIPDVVRFEVKNGNEISYDPVVGIDAASLRLFLLGSALGAVLMQRDMLVLHGNAFEIGGGCVICVGDAGAGKSTLAAAMMQRGIRVVSDDVCPITAQGRAIPGMPRIKLWQDSARRLGIATDGLRRVRPDLEKFDVPLGGAFRRESLAVRAVYMLGPPRGTAFDVQTLSGFDKFDVLRRNTYRYNYVRAMDRVGQHLHQSMALARKVPVARISRPADGFDPGGLVDCLLDDVERRDPRR